MLWFAGELDCISFVLKNQGLQHGASDQVAKLNADILDRHLVQVRVRCTKPAPLCCVYVICLCCSRSCVFCFASIC